MTVLLGCVEALAVFVLIKHINDRLDEGREALHRVEELEKDIKTLQESCSECFRRLLWLERASEAPRKCMTCVFLEFSDGDYPCSECENCNNWQWGGRSE